MALNTSKCKLTPLRFTGLIYLLNSVVGNISYISDENTVFPRNCKQSHNWKWSVLQICATAHVCCEV